MMSEEMRSQQIEMLISFFNMQAGASFRVGKQENRDAVRRLRGLKSNLSVHRAK